MKKKFLISVIFLSAVLSIGCSRKEAVESAEIRTVADLKGRRCGNVLGAAMEDVVMRLEPQAIFSTFNDYPSMMEALRLGKIDAVPMDMVILRRWVANSPDEFLLADSFADNPYGFLFQKGSPLREKVNDVLARMKSSGLLKRIVTKWCDSPDLDSVVPEPFPHRRDYRGEKGIFRFATECSYEPGAFFRNGIPVGFDIDIAQWIADELDMKFELVRVNMAALVPTVQSGKAEMGGGCITITPARAEKVDFSDCYLNDGFGILVISPRWASVRDAANALGGSGPVAFAKSLKESFIRTFITENRWKMLADGFGITLLITILAAIFGTLLAFPVWLARTSRIGLVSAFAKGYIAVLQGTPVLVLLMVLYYIVFGKVDIDGIWVAVMGFGLNLSAYAGEMLRSGVDSVPRGQTEAALALGYTPWRTFFRVVLPQAVRSILPVYRGELIGLLKSTSIVGYIAIGDLTKASDLVRSRTYESFFPIITTAIIYFIASWVLAYALERFCRKGRAD